MSSRTASPLLTIVGIVVGTVAVGAAVHHADTTYWQHRIMRAYGLAARALGVEPPRLAFSGKVANAQSDGNVVTINVGWARQILTRYCGNDACTDQVLIGVLAHELAHHSFGHAAKLRHVINTDWEDWTRHRFELDADRAAGAALARLRLGAQEFARVLELLSQRASATHPMGPARTQAIREGYQGWPTA